MAIRKNMGKGRGKGFKNLIPNQDSRTHSLSARGIKQPQKLNKGLFVVSNRTGVRGQVTREEPFAVKTFKTDGSVIHNRLSNPKFWNKDTDGDGVIDKNDCQPMNPKKQDDLDDFNNLKSDGTMTTEKPIEKKDGIFKKAFKFGKEKLEEQKAQRKKARLEELSEVNHPVVRKLVKQKDRVSTLQSQLDKEDDYDKQEKLDRELEVEKGQLREIQEQVTKINVEDLSDGQLKTLAVRHKESSFSIFGSGNEYQDELLRRITKTKEINQKIKEQKNKPVEKGFFEF